MKNGYLIQIEEIQQHIKVNKHLLNLAIKAEEGELAEEYAHNLHNNVEHLSDLKDRFNNDCKED